LVAVCAFLLVLLGLLSYFAHSIPILPGDVAISHWLQAGNLASLAPLMQTVSFVSSTVPAAIIVASLTIGLWLWGKRLEAIFIASSTSLAALLDWLLKWLIDRPRPGSELMLAAGGDTGLSFPSGHTTYAVVFYGLLFYLAPRLIKQPAARVLQSILVLLILLTGASRVFLGAHWPSDVLGSLLLGGLLLVAAIALYKNFKYQNRGRLTTAHGLVNKDARAS
jgi:undecaprenyl-diphosphatase